MTTTNAHMPNALRPRQRQHRTGRHQPSPTTIPIYITVLKQIYATIGSRPAESGGLLLGPIGRNVITDFHFDETADCTGATYTPDHVTLNRLMKQKWMPSGIDMKGFVHSHPRGVDRLSHGDLAYIERLLRANDDMDVFVAPIFLPCSYRLHPFIVERHSPRTYRRARLNVLNTHE